MEPRDGSVYFYGEGRDSYHRSAKTQAKLEEAATALKQIAKSGRKVLFVATKKQAKDIVAEQVKKVNMPYVTERWPGECLPIFQPSGRR